eukprot:7273834-Pyramimonas_sp.AAC.1
MVPTPVVKRSKRVPSWFREALNTAPDGVGLTRNAWRRPKGTQSIQRPHEAPKAPKRPPRGPQEATRRHH